MNDVQMALAWPNNSEEYVCLSCILKETEGFEALFFHVVKPKSVLGSGKCPRCLKPYGRPECVRLAQWVMNSIIIPEQKENKP